MFYYLLMAIVGLTFVVGVILFVLRRRGFRIFKTREQQETEDGLKKAFGRNTRWGFADGANNEAQSHSHHGHHSDGGGHDGGGGGDGGGGD